jgi:hypothetical protein
MYFEPRARIIRLDARNFIQWLTVSMSAFLLPGQSHYGSITSYVASHAILFSYISYLQSRFDVSDPECSAEN